MQDDLAISPDERQMILDVLEAVIDIGPELLTVDWEIEELALLGSKVEGLFTPCPFCGGPMDEVKSGERFVTLECQDCHSKVSVNGYPKGGIK